MILGFLWEFVGKGSFGGREKRERDKNLSLYLRECLIEKDKRWFH